MAIRILHVIDSLGNGGLENGVVNLVRHMDSRRFEHCICTVRGLGTNLAAARASGAAVLPLERVPGKRFQMAALARRIREVRPDVVHTRNWGGIEGAIAARLTRCATVHSEHGLESGADSVQPRRKIWFRRLAFELADRVVCVSHQLKDYHARSTGFPPRRIDVIHNGVDLSRFSPDAAVRSRMRRELNIGENDLCIGCVGSIVPVKDHDTLLRALTAPGREMKNWRVLVAGDGPRRAELENAAWAVERYGARISFLGPSSRIPELLNAFDIYVLPSLNEGISNSLLEAMATGLPVIATQVGGNPEVVEDGRSGLLFPCGDAERLAEHLMHLHACVERRRELGEEALRRVRERFSINAMVRSYQTLYETVAPHRLSARAAAKAQEMRRTIPPV